MTETEFKVLMYCGIYVDSNKLEKGIYSTSTPHLFSKEDTIEKIIHKFESLKFLNFKISDKYFENLKACELVPVVLKIKKKK